MIDPLIALAEQHDYQGLFIQELNWSRPDHKPVAVDVEDAVITATNVSSYRGLRVWVVNCAPDSKTEAVVDQVIAKTTTDRIVIFHDETTQAWRWPVRRAAGIATTATRLSRHVHKTGSTNVKFAAKLTAIRLPDNTSLDSNAVLAIVRSAFDVEVQNETRHASKLMAQMYLAMSRAYIGPGLTRDAEHQISVTLARILFLMFGDDTNMWSPNLFRDFVHRNTESNGADLGVKLSTLFEYLDTPPEVRAHSAELNLFPYVNGGIFQEHISLPGLDATFRDVILEACDRDWSLISPAIFGSMFQSVRNKDVRHQFGEYYTTEENILRLLNPLILDRLRADLRAATSRAALMKLWTKLGEVRLIDPACGCGNFIIVAFRELRDLELTVMSRLKDLLNKGSGEDQLEFEPTLALKVSLNNFYGIELDEWPARIAQAATFMVNRQCDLKLEERFGASPQRLPLTEQAAIYIGNALELDWNQYGPKDGWVVVAGNPPFAGARTMKEYQSDELAKVWLPHASGDLDYVTGWYKRAIEFLENKAGEIAFVSTNSVCQGQGVATLFSLVYSQGWGIRFAHQTFRWTSEAPGEAKVHCVIVGLSRDKKLPRRLFTHTQQGELAETNPSSISAYLVEGPEVVVRKTRIPVSPALPSCEFGSMANDGRGRKGLIVTIDDVDVVRQDSIARSYLRPFIQADELIGGKELWCLWMVGATKFDLEASPVLRERVKRVHAHRDGSDRAATKRLARSSHLFGERRQPTMPYLAIPRHFSLRRPYFTAAHYEADVICGDANFSAADPDGVLFGIISSAMFMAWQRLVGGAIKSDPRFAKEVCWNTFPLPEIKDAQRLLVSEAGRAVVAARNLHPTWTLLQHYPETGLTPELRAAHDHLDCVVDDVFGSQPGAGETERQALLIARYAALIA